MNQIDKNEILKEVGSVLQFCQDIVSRLSSPCYSSSSSTFANTELNNNKMREDHQQMSKRGDKKDSDVEAEDDDDVEDLDNDFQEEELS